jgi:hypothetical protein
MGKRVRMRRMQLGVLFAGIGLLSGCVAPVTVAEEKALSTPSPSPGAVVTATPTPATIVGLFQREDAPLEGIGFSENGIWTEYHSAKGGRQRHFRGDGVVVTLSPERGHKIVYVLSGDEIVCVGEGGHVTRYKRVMLLDVARPVTKKRAR